MQRNSALSITRSQPTYFPFTTNAKSEFFVIIPALKMISEKALRMYCFQFLLLLSCVPRQTEVAVGVPGSLRPQIISTFGTTKVVVRHPYTLTAYTTREIPVTNFQRLSRSQGTWFCRKEQRKKSPVTPPGIVTGTVRVVAKRLNHYATSRPRIITVCIII
jgi:hypothetical protein